MKSTGIVRKIDELGRVVLPKELRSTFDIESCDPLEVFVGDDGSIILKKYESACMLCNSIEDLTTFHDHYICHNCMRKMAKFYIGIKHTLASSKK
jgi:transcriptional pleiotropic regulator of transition state genes